MKHGPKMGEEFFSYHYEPLWQPVDSQSAHQKAFGKGDNIMNRSRINNNKETMKGGGGLADNVLWHLR